MKRCVVAWMLANVALSPIVAEAGFMPHVSHIPGFKHPTIAGVVTADFDGDGVEDIAVAGSQSLGALISPPAHELTGMVSVVRLDPATGAYRVDSIIAVEQHLVRLLQVPGRQPLELVAVGHDGEVSRLGGWPLRRLSTLQLGRGVWDAAVGDLDNNGTQDLAVSTINAVNIFDLETGDFLGAPPTSTSTTPPIAIDQLDADPALELIVGSASWHPGYVFDGATWAIDWTFAGGFGTRIRTGTPMAAATRGFASGFHSYYTLFGTAPYQPVSSVKVQSMTMLELVDVDLDGRDDVIEGSFSDGFRIVDATNGNVLHSSSRSIGGHAGITRNASSPNWQMTFGDISGETGHYLEVISESDQTLLRRGDEEGPFKPAYPVDLDGDGHLELAWISRSSLNGTSAGLLRVADYASGAELWRTSLSNPGTPIRFQYLLAIATAPAVPGQSHRELLVARGGFLDYVDPVRRTVRLSVNSGLGDLGIRRLLFDTANNSVIVVNVHLGISVARFDRATLSRQQLVELPADHGSLINDMKLRREAPTRAFLLASTSSSLILLDAGTLAVLWRVPVPAAGAEFVSAGSSAAHILMLGMDGRLRKVGLDGQVLATGDRLGAEVSGGLAIDPIDEAKRAFACIDRAIVVIDIESMVAEERSETIGGRPCENGDLHVVLGGGPHERRVVTGSIAGVFGLQWFEDVIFAHGFD